MAKSNDPVIIEINLEESRAQAKIEKFNRQLKTSGNFSKRYKNIVQEVQAEERKLDSIQVRRTKHLSTLSKDTKGLGNNMKQTSKSTGGAATSVLELGRVVSDAPYGIRGMANNVSQLSSNMLFSAQQIDKTTGSAIGFGGVLKGMAKSFMGPLGILFAIQAVVAAVDFFYGGMKKAAKGAKELAKDLKKLTDVVYAQDLMARRYLVTLEATNSSEQERKVAAQELIKIIPTLKDEDEKYGITLDNVRQKIAAYTIAQANRIEMDKLVEANSAILSKKGRLEEIRFMTDKVAQSKAMKKFLIEEGKSVKKIVETYVGSSQYGTAIVSKKTRDKTRQELKREFEEIGQIVTKKSKPILDKISQLSKGLILDIDKGGKGSDSKRDKVLGLDLESVDIGESAKKAKNILEAVASAMGEDMKSDPLQVKTTLNLELSTETNDGIADMIKKKAAKLVSESQLEDNISYVENSKKILSGMTDFINGEFERELVMEQNKTNALNNELKQRLQNENLSKDERQAIQDKIAQNDDKLRVKQEAIEKKRFKMQKAADMSMTIMDTAVAMMKALKIYGPTPAGFAAAGLAAAQGVIQLATIARQKFQTSAASSPAMAGGSNGASSGGGGDRDQASFNIVGMGNNNQLLEAIQAQFDKPLKAYVVSREVTRQQNLDDAIKTGAGLG